MTVSAPSRTAALLAQLLHALADEMQGEPPFSVKHDRLRAEADQVRAMLRRRERGTT